MIREDLRVGTRRTGADAGARNAWVRLRQIRSAVDPDLRLLANHAV